ncbi:hypothetical protein SAMD00019534_042320 [Acytostelium subglobosum LB1]|uniref:hypothetical protein n=1 Tax=Acytostelium subglobosum LB1 TaxID=1410327 RepID=UPI000644C861|nr:hypothetical protein SAMD00019534_042320 [Acytostelium subglobosum LB1]GAM21057.1 hypothetical protein SAMD00019534_042320 [Acytostelium subglobosum LB1]|eukprot:XP_012756191.1 hypothetical protein SAMD00019534_042320 [Acytostelium subglobosum LB1]
MFKLAFSTLIVLALLANVSFGGAAINIKSTNCTIVINDYTTYQSCGNPPVDPPGLRYAGAKRSLMATPPANWVPFSCRINGDSMMGYGAVQVTYPGPSATVNTTVCQSIGCTSILDKGTVTKWLGNYKENTTMACFYNVDNPNSVFFERAGFCGYRGIFDTTNSSCACQEGWAGDGCERSNVEPTTGSSTILIIPITIILVIAAFLGLSL